MNRVFDKNLFILEELFGKEEVSVKLDRLKYIFENTEEKWAENLKLLKNSEIRYLLICEAPPFSEIEPPKYFYNYHNKNFNKEIWKTFYPNEIFPNDKEYYFYQVFNAPLTVPDRDSIVHVTVEPFTAKRGYMMLTLTAAPDFMPPQPGKTRVAAQDYYIKFTPVDKNTTRLESSGYIDPGGVIPAWTINFVQRSAPYTSMLGLSRMVQLPYYRESKEPLDFTYME